jgi:predicted nucleic acid-binding protein
MTTTEPPHPRRCLVDTNVILRLSQPPNVAPKFHRAVRNLQARAVPLYVSFQNIAEYWNVSTRPTVNNAQELPPAQVRKNLQIIEADFEIITEDRETYERWLQLVVDFKVVDRQVHDARLVAHMLVRGIPALLTSNTKDFTRYPQIQLLDPEQVA